MNAQPISDEIALRIGLAARELPDTGVAGLLHLLDETVGLPPTIEKLSGLTLKNLKQARDGMLADVEPAMLKSALACLRGELNLSHDPLPEPLPYREGEIPNSIRVACASNQGEQLDGHFGSCRRFLIYQVSETEGRLIDIRNIDEAKAADDKNGYRASLISDCQLLFVVSIGGPAVAKVVRAGAHPIKKPEAGSAPEEIGKLQTIIGTAPPPWLAKAMGVAAEQRVRFERETVE